MPGGQFVQCIQPYIGLLAQPLKQIREGLQRQRRVSLSEFLEVVMVHDGHHRKLAAWSATRFSQRGAELGHLARAGQLSEPPCFNQPMFAARRQITEALIRQHAGGVAIKGVKRRHESPDRNAKSLFKHRPASRDLFQLFC